MTVEGLQTHNVVEHDVSMSREDYNMGDHINYSKKTSINVYI